MRSFKFQRLTCFHLLLLIFVTSGQKHGNISGHLLEVSGSEEQKASIANFSLRREQLRGRPLYYTLPHQDLDPFVSNILRRSGEAQNLATNLNPRIYLPENHLKNLLSNASIKPPVQISDETNTGYLVTPPKHPFYSSSGTISPSRRISNDRFMASSGAKPVPNQWSVQHGFRFDTASALTSSNRDPRYPYSWQHTTEDSKIIGNHHKVVGPPRESYTNSIIIPKSLHQNNYPTTTYPVRTLHSQSRHPSYPARNQQSTQSIVNKDLMNTVRSYNEEKQIYSNFRHQYKESNTPLLEHLLKRLRANGSDANHSFRSKYPLDSAVAKYQQKSDQRHEVTKSKRAKLPTALEVLGGGAAAAATAFFINAGVLFISSRSGISLRRRRETEHTLEDTEVMVEEFVKLWAAFEDKDECRVRACCKIGQWLGSYRGGSILTLIARYLLSPNYEKELNHVIKGAIYNSDCRQWKCGKDLQTNVIE